MPTGRRALISSNSDDLVWLFRRSLNPVRRLVLSRTRRDHPGPRVLANSVQKAGTHMLMTCLGAFPGLVPFHWGVFVLGGEDRDPLDRQRWLERMGGGCFVVTHLSYSRERERFLTEHGFRSLLMVRDPRDVVVSLWHFALRRRRHPFHDLFVGQPDDDARLMLAITGDDDLGLGPVVIQRFRRMMRWLERGSHIVRFENLVGPEGGGTKEAQLDEIGRMAEYLGVGLDGESLRTVAHKVFDRTSRTFRQGQIGSWKQCFKAEHKEAFERVADSLLEDLGYERGPGW